VPGRGFPGRPPEDRTAIARAFIAKQVYDIPTRRMLLDRLESDANLRRICGWERKSDVPKEWTFARTFAQLATRSSPERVHEAPIANSCAGELVGHLSGDCTAIEAREKPVKEPVELTEGKPGTKRGRPKNGEGRSR
jgi:hypothetical protein